jgi:peptidoglycan/xylan/chitin deacetylase (PgdA/CDA1 family)
VVPVHEEWRTLKRRLRTAGALAARTALGIGARVSGGGLVLTYHRVTTPGRDPQQLAVSPANFEQQLDVLVARALPMPFEDLAAATTGADVPAGAVAVTFDDGYADNLHEALPLLENAGVPATVFVTTGQLGGEREFWWDELERLLLADAPGDANAARGADVATARASRVRLDGADGPREFDVGHADARKATYDALHPWMRPWPTDAIEAALMQLRAWAGEPEAGAQRESHRTLTPDELRQLADAGPVAIGAHTEHHPSLAAQPAAAQSAEIVGSKRELEQALDRAVTTMSYPFGTRADASRITRRAARDAGYRFAAANEAGHASRWASPWFVPRHLVRDLDGAAFENWLDARLGRP